MNQCSSPVVRAAKLFLGVVCLSVVGILVPGGCGSGANDRAERSYDKGDSPAATETVSLRVMSFNIEWGGTHVRFASISEAIRAADADIVGIQEAEGNLARLAGDLGWYYNLRNYVISRYPLIDPADAGGKYVLIEVSPGKVIAMGNVHLPSSPSGAAWLRAGRTAAEVVAMERRIRLPKIEPFIEELAGFAGDGMPVILSGDFNTPSHQDWTEATIGRFPHRDHAVIWPVTAAVAAAGFRDSFRYIHQNPVTHPGFTWWAARPAIPEYNPTDESRRSRIDFLWYDGPAKVSGSRIVGEADTPEVTVSVTPWPSDHRAVVSDLDVIPTPMPLVVAAERRVHTVGKPLRFFYRNRTPRGSLVVERHSGGEITTERRIGTASDLGTLQLPDAFLHPGRYQVLLQDDAGGEVSRNDFWVVAPDAKPSIEIAGQRFANGEPLPLAWQNAPGNRHDWVGVFEATGPDERRFLTWGYVDARSSGEMQLSSATAEEGWPLPPGRYVVRLLLDDGFGLLAESAPFFVD